MARTRYIPHDQDREDQKAEEQAERRASRKAEVPEPDAWRAKFGGLDPNDPEFDSVEAFAESLMDDNEAEFDYRQLMCLNYRLRQPGHQIRADLEGYGLRWRPRTPEQDFRGFRSNPNDRWSAYPSHGGGGGGSIMGMAD